MDRKAGIAFGTDGWRDVIGFGFHAGNLSRVSRAYAEHLTAEGADLVVIGWDTRFNGALFARFVAEIMSASGLDVLVSESPLPTPALSFAVRHHGAGGGVMLTASHNPPEYQGFKIKGPYGGTATTEIYRSVASRLGTGTTADAPIEVRGRGAIGPLRIRTAYFDALASLVDVNALRGLDGAIVHDAMGGAGAGWLAGFVAHVGLGLRVSTLRDRPDPYFYGVNPEPLPANLAPTMKRMRRSDAHFATATDGDGDRLGIVLPGGEFFNSHQIFAVLLDLMSARGATGEVVKTFTVSRVIERLAASRGLTVRETPVGFKHIVDAFLAGNVLIGGEESGGIGVAGHIPERDGVANSLLLLEAMARRGASLAEIFADIEREVGWRHAYERLDLELAGDGRKEALMADLAHPPASFAGRGVASVELLDGIKLNLEDDAWLLFRASGTEPVLRIYCEAASTTEVRRILGEAERFARGDASA